MKSIRKFLQDRKPATGAEADTAETVRSCRLRERETLLKLFRQELRPTPPLATRRDLRAALSRRID